jgi:hypothetical protein
MSRRIHGFSFFFPAELRCETAGSLKKEPGGGKFRRATQICLAISSLKKLCLLVKHNCGSESPIQVGCLVELKFQPVVLQLSATDFPVLQSQRCLVIVQDGLPFYRGQFKLRAHLLDLRGLLSELGCERLYLLLLLRDRCFQLLNFVIQHGSVLELGALVT